VLKQSNQLSYKYFFEYGNGINEEKVRNQVLGIVLMLAILLGSGYKLQVLIMHPLKRLNMHNQMTLLFLPIYFMEKNALHKMLVKRIIDRFFS
jgi:hypothetical protein